LDQPFQLAAGVAARRRPRFRGSVAPSARRRRQRGVVAAVRLVVIGSHDGVFVLLAIVATLRAASKTAAPPEGDKAVLGTYLALVVGLALLMAAAQGDGSSLP